jgi:hypothetical protein
MRFESGVVTIREDDHWLEALPSSSRRLVSVLTWPGLAAHGYVGGTARE